MRKKSAISLLKTYKEPLHKSASDFSGKNIIAIDFISTVKINEYMYWTNAFFKLKLL